MDFIFVALGAAFWAAIALMARACDALEGRKGATVRPPESSSIAAAGRRVAK